MTVANNAERAAGVEKFARRLSRPFWCFYFFSLESTVAVQTDLNDCAVNGMTPKEEHCYCLSHKKRAWAI